MLKTSHGKFSNILENGSLNRENLRVILRAGIKKLGTFAKNQGITLINKIVH